MLRDVRWLMRVLCCCVVVRTEKKYTATSDAQDRKEFNETVSDIEDEEEEEEDRKDDQATGTPPREGRPHAVQPHNRRIGLTANNVGTHEPGAAAAVATPKRTNKQKRKAVRDGEPSDGEADSRCTTPSPAGSAGTSTASRPKVQPKRRSRGMEPAAAAAAAAPSSLPASPPPSAPMAPACALCEKPADSYLVVHSSSAPLCASHKADSIAKHAKRVGPLHLQEWRSVADVAREQQEEKKRLREALAERERQLEEFDAKPTDASPRKAAEAALEQQSMEKEQKAADAVAQSKLRVAALQQQLHQAQATLDADEQAHKRSKEKTQQHRVKKQVTRNHNTQARTADAGAYLTRRFSLFSVC